MIRSKGLYYVELLFFFAAVLLIKNESIFFSWETSDKLLHILPIVVFCLLVAVFQSIFIEKRLIRICFGFLFFAVISVITYHYYSMIQLRFLLTVVPTVFALLSYREAAFAEMNQTKKKSKQKNTRNNRWFCFFYAIATILCVWGFANCKKNSILFHFFPDYIKSAVLILLSFVIFLYLLLRSFAGSKKITGRKKNSWNWNPYYFRNRNCTCPHDSPFRPAADHHRPAPGLSRPGRPCGAEDGNLPPSRKHALTLPWAPPFLLYGKPCRKKSCEFNLTALSISF